MAHGTGAALLLVYVLTLAPGVTFWDAGEFIAAASGLGIPHPPGTPLYVALGRAWIVGTGWLLGSARAMNLLSALCTALAGGVTAWMIARETRTSTGSAWGAATGGLVAGLMCSAWANATETEVYAISLLHVALMLGCALRAGDAEGDDRWLVLTAYAIALAPALHLSALVGAPAAIVLAARRERGWSWHRAVLLGGVVLATAGVGRMSWPLVALGAGIVAVGVPWGGRTGRGARVRVLLLIPLAASALLVMLVRARHDPLLNQGDPATLRALADVVARRQYAVAALIPRQAPAWLQAANVAQYADWQVAMGWGRGVFTTPARVLATLAYVALGIAGWRAMRRDAARLAMALATLVACGSIGVAAYLNLKAGASLGWGLLADGIPHEARERDYFFVLAFWGWGCLAGWGALALARRMRRVPLALLAATVPLVANWSVVDRAREPVASAARRFALGLLERAPPRAVLFTSGDNDSYPLWYLQQVEGVRPDVQIVTLPLLPAAWYGASLSRRTGLHWATERPAEGALWQHEQTAAAIARAASDAGRPVAASPALTSRERALLGMDWTLRGPVYVAGGPATGAAGVTRVDSAAARAWMGRPRTVDGALAGLPDDVSAMMLQFLDCPRLGLAWTGTPAARDSLEVRCNVR